MPMIGWIFLLLAVASVVGGLLMLRDSANFRMTDEKREKVRQRQAELEEKEKKEDDW